MKRLLIIGTGGHGKVCADIAEKMGLWDEIVFADDNPHNGFPYHIIGKSNIPWVDDCFIGIGNAEDRERLSVGRKLVTLIHPNAVVGNRVEIGDGSVIMAGAVINPDILGGFDEDYGNKIKVAESEGWLRYHGYQFDVRPFIKNCHCFVLPSWHEGMANTNLECAASGRPVITSNIHGCLEAVEDGVSGYLCESKNADSLYRIMKHVTELPSNQRSGMGLAGRKRMEEIFDKRKVVEETISHL